MKYSNMKSIFRGLKIFKKRISTKKKKKTYPRLTFSFPPNIKKYKINIENTIVQTTK